jgi:CheY-like chemotaxis protein
MHSELVFQKHLRSALNHLYNRDFLRNSPLLEALGLSGASDAPLILQRIINEAIEALKPADHEPMNTDKRRIYDILIYRYIEQFKQEEVAHHIGVSIRQLKREQDRAIETLVYYLWEKYGLANRQEEDFVEDASQEKDLSSNEWNWLLDSRTDWVTDTKQLTEETLRLLQPLANQYGVRMEFALVEELPELAVHPIAFRQILLNLGRIAIDQASGNSFVLKTAVEKSYVQFHYITHSKPAEQLVGSLSDEESNLLAIAEELINVSGGQLTIEDIHQEFRARLTLPIIDSIPVLVVDDNAEIIDLLTRYSVGTRYRIIGSAQPEQALQIAIETGAKIVVLDVMMPKMDGWELLGRFRNHPKTAHIPVIIQSILTQRDLAISLGAKALLLKPVKQEAFLKVLDQIAEELHLNWYGAP